MDLATTALLQRILLLAEEKYTYHENRQNKFTLIFSSKKTLLQYTCKSFVINVTTAIAK